MEKFKRFLRKSNGGIRPPDTSGGSSRDDDDGSAGSSNLDNQFYNCIFKNKMIWKYIVSFVVRKQPDCKTYYEINDAEWMCKNKLFPLLKYKLTRLQQQKQQLRGSGSSILSSLNIRLSSDKIMNNSSSCNNNNSSMSSYSTDMDSDDDGPIIIREEKEILNWSTECFELILKHSHDLSLVTLLYSKNYQKEFKPITEKMKELDYSFNNLEITGYLHSLGRGATKVAMNKAAKHGNLGVVKFLNENRAEGCTKHGMDMASERGHLEVLVYLNEKRKEGFTCNSLEMAMRNSHYNVVKFLLENKCNELLAMYTRDSVDLANLITIASHDLSMLRLIHKHFGSGVSSSEHIKLSMRIASKNADLEMVKYIHYSFPNENCRESTIAMDCAAVSVNGLPILRFLHENGYRASEESINQSTHHRQNLESIKYLVESCQIRFSIRAVQRAAEFGQLEILKYLFENRSRFNQPNIIVGSGQSILSKNPDVDDSNNLIHDFSNFNYSVTIRRGYLPIIQFLWENCGFKNKNFDDSLKQSVQGKQLQIVKFLLENKEFSEFEVNEALSISSSKGYSAITQFIESFKSFKT